MIHKLVSLLFSPTPSIHFAGLICAGVLAIVQPSANGPEGSWHGTLEAGSAKLRLVLTISRSADGEYKGIMESLDQGATIPADKVTINAKNVRIEFQRISGSYEGVIDKDGNEISGTWSQGGRSTPLTFQRAAADTVKKEEQRPAGAQQKPLSAPIDVVVPIAPTAFQADGKTHLAYELHVTNFSSQVTTLGHIEVLNDKGSPLLRMEQLDLLTSVLLTGNHQAAGTDKLNIGAGQMAIVYMWISVDSPAAVPATLEHKITVKAGPDKEDFTVQCGRVIPSLDVVTISAPLRGDNWLAANGPSNTSAHRRALIPVDGQARIAQRFAIDWVRLNEAGTTFTGDPKDNKNYRAEGSEALAVADGIVTETKDRIPENVPGVTSRAVPITLETIGGNHVILDIGHGHYAFYAHLQPGSLKVRVGDRVKRGQVLGLVGNSGNSTEPHLHFHLADRNSPLAAEGIPYALESFQVKAKAGSNAVEHKMEIPSENEVVTFPDK